MINEELDGYLMFDYIEDEKIKERLLKINHTDYVLVYRALRSNLVTKEDFVPSIVENSLINKKKATLKANNLSSYSVSLSLSIEGIIHIMKVSHSFADTHKGIASGFTTRRRGISIQTSQNSPHVDYYLFDYKTNNPSEDFEVVL